MSKKVIKGWVANKVGAEEIFGWDNHPTAPALHATPEKNGATVYGAKGSKKVWAFAAYPPKRVTITIEVEDA